MTAGDAEGVLFILTTVYEPSYRQVTDLFRRFLTRWPEHLELAKSVYKQELGQELNLERE